MLAPISRPAVGRRRRRAVQVALLLALGLVGALLAGCASGSALTGKPGDTPTTQAPRPPSIAVDPPAGAIDVAPLAPVTVTVTDGKLDQVTMTSPEGTPVAGQPDSKSTTWTFAEPLGYGTAYMITATATGEDSKPFTTTSSFTTVAPRSLAYPSMNPLDGQTVGVGQPLAVYFDQQVENKQAAEDAIAVNANPPVEGAFYWFSDSEVHWRPQDFWVPGSTVTMDINVYGRDLGNGVYGDENRRATFTIGDAVIARADGATHQMTVEINGAVVRTMPISMGEPAFPSNNGTHVVTERHETKVMDSSTFGLQPIEGGYITEVKWATRISNGGEFVHAAPWSVGDQGHRNVSHGCVNLSTENAKWFFDTVKKGDVVFQTNTGGPDLQPYDGFGDWQIPWEQWLSGGGT